MRDQTLLIAIALILIIMVVVVVFFVVFIDKRKKNIEKEVTELDKEKNLIASTPVLSELSKVESIVKNDKMEEKYQYWQKRFEVIKGDRLTKINDMITELDLSVTAKDYKNAWIKMAQTELEIYKAKIAADHLMEEIREITVSEEKYRSIVIKLKTKYRSLTNEFEAHKDDYDEIGPIIELQFENIEKRFLDFESIMENNEYNEVVHVVKALDTMIDHMSIVIEEVPQLVLLAKQLIPKRMEDIEHLYASMITEAYPLDYLNIPYNMEETKKNITNIMDRIRVLNLEECMFELKTILDYLDSLFTDFENEKTARKNYEDNIDDFENKLKRLDQLVADIYLQMDDIKNMYDLTDNDLTKLNEVRDGLEKMDSDFQSLTTSIEEKKEPYTTLYRELAKMTIQLQQLEENLDISLKSLGSMYDDEVRAREQLDEIQIVLKQCKLRIRSYKLPIISNNYFVELAEANEAILEIIKELEKKPIEIKILNTRVDTARDLVLKLFNTTNEMIRTAQLAEMAIVYGNRYRAQHEEVHMGLRSAEMLFYKGNYKGALETSINTLELVEPGIHKQLLDFKNKSVSSE